MNNNYIIGQLTQATDLLNELKGYLIGNSFISQQLNFIPKSSGKKVINFKNDILGQNKEAYSNIGKGEEENMPGCLSLRKDGRWMGRFYFMGKQQCVYARSKTECSKKMRERKADLTKSLKNSPVPSKKKSLNEFFDFWVNNFKAQRVKESTLLKTKEVYTRYIRYTLGELKIDKIDYLMIQKFINDLTAYSAKKLTLQILKELYDILYKEKQVAKNPTNLVFVPKKNKESIVKEKKIKEVITSVDEEIIFNCCKKGSPIHLALKFILYTGLRRGECLGLQWKNVNLEENKIYIDRQWNLVLGRISEPKTANSIRYVPLFDDAKMILTELNKKPHSNEDYVFNNAKNITQRTCELSRDSCVHFSVHTLRHTFATRCYAAGVDPKSIQMLLGHESVDTTLNTYVHLIKQTDEDVLKRMRDFFINNNIINDIR